MNKKIKIQDLLNETVTEKEKINTSDSEKYSPLTPKSRRDLRTLAFYFIYSADRFDYSETTEDIINVFLQEFNIDIEKDSFAIQAATGTIEQRNELDVQIKPLLKNWKFERLGCCTRLILRLALWELNQKDAVPGIVINEAIELAKAFAEKDAYKFINGLLDEAFKIIHKEKTSQKKNSK
jgi:transcription antitermination protein NusB